MGKVNLVALAATHELTTEELLATWLEKLRLNGYKIISDVDEETLKIQQHKGRKIVSWNGHANTEDLLISLNTTIIYHKRGILMVNLISPPQSSNHEAWAINYRYYEILLQTSQLG